MRSRPDGPARRGADQIAFGVRLVHADVGVGAAGQFDLGTAGRVGRAGAALEHAGAGQQLGAMADGGHGLVVVEEVAHGGAHGIVVAQVFGAASAGDHQGVVLLGLDVGEAGVEREVVAGLFAVGLGALEIMDGRLDVVPAFLSGQTACTVCPTACRAWNRTMVS